MFSKYDINNIKNLPGEDIRIFNNYNDVRFKIKLRDEETEKNSTYDLMAFVDYLYKLRHDSLHYQVMKSLKLKISNETRIGEVVDGLNRNRNKSPDIVYIQNEIINIFEITISSDYIEAKEKKMVKYDDLVKEISEIGNTVMIHIISISPTLKNLDEELQLLKKVTNKDFTFDYKEFSSFHNYICDKIEQLTKTIPGEFLFWYNSMKLDKLKYTMRQNMIRDDIDIDVPIKLAKEKYPYFENLENVEKKDIFTEGDFCEYMKTILEDDKNIIKNKFEDIINDSGKYETAKNEIINLTSSMNKINNSKPTHHILTPQENVKFNSDSEQKNIDDLFNYIYQFIDEFERPVGDDGRLDYVYNTIKEKNKIESSGARGKENNFNMYNYGNFFNDNLKEEKNKQNYNQLISATTKREKDINKGKSGNEKITAYKKNYTEYLVDEGEIDIDINETYYCKQNTMKLSKDAYKRIDSDYHRQAGIGAKSNYDMKQKEREKNLKNETLQFDDEDVVENLLNELSCETEQINPLPKTLSYLITEPGMDNTVLQEQKKQYINIYMKFVNILRKTNCFWYSYINHYMYSQLFYHSTIRMDSKMVVFCGLNISDYAMIINGCYSHPENSPGKPFMCIYKTKTPQAYTTGIYGDVISYKLKNCDEHLCITNWRRLNMNKIVHCKDAFYSTLSSTVGSCMNMTDEFSMSSKKMIKIYSHRVTLSLCTSQRIQELMMDTRYAYMSAFSSHTNITKLLTEKFGPPYKNHMHLWVVKRLLNGLPQLHKEVYSGDNILINVPKFKNKRRDEESVGGSMKLPSVWYKNEQMLDPQDVLDEAFVYIHTMKEPSSIYHEQIKAINTIVEFEEEYKDIEKNDPSFVNGLMDINGVDKFLKSRSKIGYCAQIIKYSTKRNIEIEKPFFEEIVTQINNEPLSELISTKAVIHDINRKVEEIGLTGAEQKRQKERYKVITGVEINNDSLEKVKKEKYIVTESVYNKNKPRQKLMETIMMILEKNKNYTRTMDIVTDFFDKNCPVLADICIKSQYGSKREFYVINIEAKAAARCVENFYKKLCENSPCEAISIPGDQKLIEMQRMLDDSFRIRKNRYLRYVNGDCTKWSAAETMGSFIAMTNALKDKTGENIINLINLTFSSWANKEIQVPLSICSKTFEIDEKVKKLNKQMIPDRKINSTQNFLQGMFNYASSYKSVCCGAYAYHIWKMIYPDTNLEIKHMVHSDDYVTIILYDTEEDFKRYRVLHKIMMRLHGFSDSERKTSCQSTFLEFVSLMSFNGNMMYPKIKKMKDINSNLPCLGYRYDVDTVLSRVGECLRIGCNLAYCYFFQRLHLSLVMENYSVQPGMRNNNIYQYADMHNRPAEMFGCPDPHPIYSIFCKGNSNNYRLYKYTDEGCNLLKNLYKQSIQKDISISGSKIDSQYGFTLLNPNYIHEDKNSSIIQIRKNVNFTKVELDKFWDEHIMYKFLKPIERERLYTWTKAMFFDRSFAEAYIQSSRVQLTLRVARFSSKRVIKDSLDFHKYESHDDYIKDAITISEYIHKMSTKYNDLSEFTEEDDKYLYKIITKCDPNYELIDNMVKGMTYGLTTKRRKQIAIKTPYPTKSYSLTNSPAIIMQYLLNQKDFEEDKRQIVSEKSFISDIELVTGKLGFDPETKNIMEILMCYNDLVQLMGNRIVMIGYNRDSQTIEEVINDIFTHQNEPYFSTRINLTGTTIIRHPWTSEIVYKREQTLQKSNISQQISTLSSIHVYMRKIMKVEDKDCRDFLRQTLWLNDENRYVDFKTMLQNITWELMEDNGVSFMDMKTMAYLKIIYQNEYDTISKLTTSAYSYSYNYIRRSQNIGGNYSGECMFTFMYLKKKFLCYYDEIEKIPYLFTNQNHGSYNIPAYNISRKLCNQIGERELISTIHSDTLGNIEISEESLKKIQQKTKMRINGFLNKDGKKITEQKKYNNKHIPIFITNEVVHKSDYNKKINIPQNYFINDEKMFVLMGKHKLYNYPLNNLQIYPVVKSINENIEWDKFKINDLLKTDTISRYLNNKKINYRGSVVIDENVIIEMKSKISQNNNYNNFIRKFSYKNIIEDNLKVLEEIMNNTEDIYTDNNLLKVPIETRNLEGTTFEDNVDNYENNQDDPTVGMFNFDEDDEYGIIGSDVIDIYKNIIDEEDDEEVLNDSYENNEFMNLTDMIKDDKFLVYRTKRKNYNGFKKKVVDMENKMSLRLQILYENYTDIFPNFIDICSFLCHFEDIMEINENTPSKITTLEVLLTSYYYITNERINKKIGINYNININNNDVDYFVNRVFLVNDSEKFLKEKTKTDYTIMDSNRIMKKEKTTKQNFIKRMKASNDYEYVKKNLKNFKNMFMQNIMVEQGDDDLTEIFL